MTRRRALWLLGAGASALLVVLSLVDLRLWDEGGPGIVGFELAGSAEEAADIRAEWGPDGHDAARLSLWLDFAFIAFYGGFWTLAARAVGGRRVALLAPLAAACDVLEDVMLLLVLGGHGGDLAPPLAAGLATVKFLAIGVVVAYVCAVVIRRLHRRRPRAVRAAALAAVGAAVVFLAVNTWLVERATEPAAPEPGGRVLRVPGGDVHVREDGDRRDPPLVLIHGFAASMRWWDAVVPALAREHRVIRLDLLGHGGSEKPRDGYSMERQADLVAEVMDRLGVRRAPVIAHSMGGVVATALVERHPERVTRLMTIGTPPDGEHEPNSLPGWLALSPVTGHAVDTLVRRGLVRNVVEAGFAPEFDPPEGLSRDIFERTTWSAFHGSDRGMRDYLDELPVHRRLARSRVPVTAVFGERERQTRRAVRLYNTIPGARTVVMEGLDHSPQIEAPGRTAALIAAFAAG